MRVAIPAKRISYAWGTQAFYRAFSLVNGGRTIERDLFEGLRNPTNAAT